MRRSIDVLDPENQSDPDSFGPDPGLYGLQLDASHQKNENQKEGLQNYLEYSLNNKLNIFYRSGYRALDPEFGQNRTQLTAIKPTCHLLKEITNDH